MAEPVSIMGQVVATDERNVSRTYPVPLETFLYLELSERERLPNLLNLGVVYLEVEYNDIEDCGGGGLERSEGRLESSVNAAKIQLKFLSREPDRIVRPTDRLQRGSRNYDALERGRNATACNKPRPAQEIVRGTACEQG